MYKDILLHVDGSPACAHRLGAALALAGTFGGRIKAVFARRDHDRAAMIARTPSDALRREAAQARAGAEERTAAADIPLVWLEASSGHPEDLVRELVVAARFSDIAVVSQPDGEHWLPDVPNSLVEDLIRHSGRPVLVLPATGWTGTLGKRILLAWNASREAARALGDALALLRGAGEVVVLSHRPADARIPADGPWPGILDHLSRHGVAATHEDMAGDDIGVMDMLLSRAADHGSDLIVMGAHGEHDSLFARSGVGTRFILRHMTVPILMAH